MQLSIIIVNYNVKHFLEQCLCSVRKAIAPLAAEVIVIDNSSSDNSVGYLQDKFPFARFVSNKENIGFAKACNQGAAMATGSYLLFLNPDTIVPEDCFVKCIEFLEKTADAGALGVKMVDGSGKFLPESKRAFPSPATSLYKLFGLARIFPRSGTFARYHLGHLDANKINKVDVLAGAFMLVRRTVFEKTGGFDESFFMYGEDVDLSYRIQKEGLHNYYFPNTSIIHFKGESTRKGSMNYVRMFYKAMSTFVRKHYGGGRAGIFNFLIHTAIWFRAGLTAIANFIRNIGLPLIDAAIILFSFWLVKTIWNEYIRTDIHYENKLLWIAFPAFTLFYLLTAYFAGLYDRWYKRSELARSTFIATVVLLAAYALLPEKFRFSRAIILFGGLLAFLLTSILRWALVRAGVLSSSKEKNKNFNTVIAGTQTEFDETVGLLASASMDKKVLGRIAVDGQDSRSLGSIKDIKSLAHSVPFKELIFCEGKMSFSEIIVLLQALPEGKIVKLHASGSKSIVGSHSRDMSGESVSHENGFNLSNPYNRRVKRLIDISVAVIGLLTFPLQIFLVKKPFSFFANCFSVIAGTKTWIGYASAEKNIPLLRKAVIACNGIPSKVRQSLPKESLQMIDYWYARDYEPLNDLKLIVRVYRNLGE